MKKSLVFAAVISLTFVLAACGSKDNGDSTGGTGTGSSANLADAEAYLKPYLSAPTGISIDTPLSKAAPANQKVIGLNAGLGVAVTLSKYWKQAAEDLGWTYVDINSGATPETQQKAFESALQQNPDGILLAGVSAAVIKKQLEQAKEQGVWVSVQGSIDKPEGALYDTSIAGEDQVAKWGKTIAAYVAVNSGGMAKVIMVKLSGFPVTAAFDEAFAAGLKEFCAGCKIVAEAPQLGTDIGTKTPASVVSAVQSNPDADWLFFDNGNLSIGVNPALKAAGLTDQVKLVGTVADLGNTAGVKAGTESAWTSYSLPLIAYLQMDSLARKLLGDPAVPAVMPTQLITKDNIDTITTDAGGNYVGVKSYREDFKKLWLVN